VDNLGIATFLQAHAGENIISPTSDSRQLHGLPHVKIYPILTFHLWPNLAAGAGTARSEEDVGLPSPLTRVRRRKVRAMGLAAGVAGVAIRGIEVTQAIQDMQNSVVLVAGKATVARAYIDPTTVARAGNVTGEVIWRRTGSAGASFLPAMNSIRIDPARPKTLPEQRNDLSGSLNFLLPAEAMKGGALELSVKRLFAPGGDDLVLAPQLPVRVSVADAAPLRVRVIGLRYQTGDPSTALTPNAVHFAYLKSFLERAYPVASVEWSQIVVDADFAFCDGC